MPPIAGFPKRLMKSRTVERRTIPRSSDRRIPAGSTPTGQPGDRRTKTMYDAVWQFVRSPGGVITLLVVGVVVVSRIRHRRKKG